MLAGNDKSIASAIEITVESVEEAVTMFVVENRVGGKLLCEQSLLPRLLFLKATYNMERECAWPWRLEMASKLAEVTLQRGKWIFLSFF